MVAPAQHYFIRSRTGERGPYTLSQVSTMWASGSITADSFYRLSNVEDWSPISQLEETLGAITGSGLTKQTLTSLPPVVLPKRVVHSRIVEGDGSRESPFVINALNYFGSVTIQSEIVDLAIGEGAYRATKRRVYYTSSRGKPGNSDVCEYVFDVDGREVSVWFDLYLVTQWVENPEYQREVKSRVESPQGRAVQSAIQKAFIRARPELQEKSSFGGLAGRVIQSAIQKVYILAHPELRGKSGIGCFVVTVILIFLAMGLIGRL